MHNEYGLWLDSVDVEAMSPTQVSRWTMYARYGFMVRIKEAVWCHDRISNDGKTTFSPTIAESRTSQKRQRARSFGLIAFRTPRLPRFTFCATAEIET